MKNIRTIILFSAFAFGLSLHAAVDEINSYFTVSQHAAALGTVVDVTIYLRDENNNPVRAANIAVESSSFDVTVVEEPKAGSNGRYRARIKADVATDADISVVADGVAIQENILPNPSFELGVGTVPGYVSTYTQMYDYSSFEWCTSGFRSKRSLESYAFDPRKGTYWGFGSIAGDHLLRDRAYEVSIYAKYDHVDGEYGVTLQTTQIDAAGNVLPGGNRYHGRNKGSSDWIKLALEEPLKIMDKATGLNVTATLLAASGHVQYDAARIRVSPTIRWGQPDGSIKIGTPKNCRMFPHISFSTALKLTVDQYDKMLAEVLKASPESEALKPFVADQEKYHQWLDAKLTSSDAFIKRQEILKRIPQLKEARKAAVDQELEDLL